MPKKIDLTIELQRKLLGSISLDDIDIKEESESEHKDYIAAIFAVYPRLERTLKKFLYEQLMFSSNKAENWELVIFGRGTTNGIALLLEHFKQSASEYEASLKKEEEV